MWSSFAFSTARDLGPQPLCPFKHLIHDLSKVVLDRVLGGVVRNNLTEVDRLVVNRFNVGRIQRATVAAYPQELRIPAKRQGDHDLGTPKAGFFMSTDPQTLTVNHQRFSAIGTQQALGEIRDGDVQ